MTSSILSDKQFKLFFSSFWLIWASLHAWLLHLVGLSLYNSLTDSFVSNLILAGSCLMVSNNMRYYLPRREKYIYIVIVSIMLSLVCVYSAKWLLETIFEDNFFAEFIRIYTFLKFCGAFLLISCMSMFSLMWYTQQDQNEIAVHQAETLQLAKDAELYKLRHQLQPHFLFNSLNSISALTASQPEKARYMIQQLSDFLRVTLKQDEKQWSNIDEEMQYLQLYLDIEKVRFGHRLQTDIIKNDNTNDLQIPSFLLQPIVENAIKFGLYDTTDNVIISIHINKENQSLFVKIENPFDAETAQTIAGTGFGLSSIRRRLYLLFARNDLLKTTTEKQLFTTTITIPQNYESRNN